jgi:DNA-binding SARP family transcriptional activator
LPSLKLCLLGPPRIERDGKPIAFDTRKAIALMAYLSVTGQPQSREHLAALLWPDADQSHALGALRRTLSTLNSALDGQGVIAQRDSVEIAPAVWCDVATFCQCLKTGQTGDAIALYGGDFMAGFALRDNAAFEEWQFGEAESLHRELAQALEAQVQREITTRRYDQAILLARRWLALDPLHEAAHRQLMHLFALDGDRTAALKQYRECVRVLDEELGVPPLAETTRLYEAIKEGEPWLHAMPPAATAANDAVQSTQATPLSKPQSALVGRDQQWELLLSAHRAAAQGGHLVVLEGEAGIGKTRLALDFLAHVRAQGATALIAHCYERETTLAYAPILEIARAIVADPALAARLTGLPESVLVEGARLLPELAGVQAEAPAVRSLDAVAARLRFFDAVTQTISAVLAPAGPGAPANVLFIDDAQWADEATLDLLTYTVRRLSGQPVLWLLAWRGELVPLQHRLRQLFGQAVRDHRATSISLSRLSLPSTEALLRAALDAIPGLRLGEAKIETLAGRLHAESEGLPLFVAEYIAMLQGDPSVTQSAWPMPQTIRDMLRSRLAGLDDAGAQLLGTASAIGRAFDFDLLQQVSGRSEDETADGLDRLIGLGLVREAGGESMDFAHEKLREVAYDGLSLTRRRLLHRRTAEALSHYTTRHHPRWRRGIPIRPDCTRPSATCIRWPVITARRSAITNRRRRSRRARRLGGSSTSWVMCITGGANGHWPTAAIAPHPN